MLNSTDKLVEAYVLDDNGEKDTISFKVSRIDYLRSLGQEFSAIVLHSGVTIPVNTAYADLKKRIYNADFKNGPEIDLKEITGMPSLEVTRLNNNFSAEKNSASKSVAISALLRRANSSEMARVEFSEDDIKSLVPVSTNRSRSGYSIKIKFNDSSKRPFGSEGVILDMPHDDFQAFLHEAKRQGNLKLDLCGIFTSNKSRYGYKL